MAALESAERAVRTLREVPAVFGAVAAFAVLKLPVAVTRPLRITLDVYAVLALLTFLFTPVLLAGVYGVAATALEAGRPGSFWEAVGDGYGNLLVANVVYALAHHLLTLVFTVLAVAVFVGLAGGLGVATEGIRDPAAAEQAATAAGLVAIGGVVVVSLVYLVVRLALAFFLQLYKPAAVLGGEDPLGAFAESVALVRANPRSTLAFLLVRYVAMVVLLLPGVVAMVALLVADPAGAGAPDGAAAGAALVVVVVVGFAVGVVQLAFLSTYRVAFYRSLAGS